MKATTVSVGADITANQLEFLRGQLIASRDQLLERLTRLEESNRKPLSPDSSERAVELEDVEVRRGLVIEGEQELRHMLSALERIRKETYGSCLDCGNAIGWQRLEARPHAQRCIECRRNVDNESSRAH